MPVTIYHNPKCGTSRSTLALIRERGLNPVVVEYLKTPPSREELKGLLAEMPTSLRDLLRKQGTPYEELGLDDESLTDDQLLDAIGEHPILMNRPVVKTEKGARLCRPADIVLEIL